MERLKFEPMDLSPTLESFASVIKTLQNFPKQRKLPAVATQYITGREAECMRKNELVACTPFLIRRIEEINSHITGYGPTYFEAVKERQEYIEQQIQEIANENQAGAERHALLKKLTQLKTYNSAHLQKICFTENESLQIIRLMHEKGPIHRNKHLTPYISKYAVLSYPTIDKKEVMAYEKIISMLDNQEAIGN